MSIRLKTILMGRSKGDEALHGDTYWGRLYAIQDGLFSSKRNGGVN